MGDGWSMSIVQSKRGVWLGAVLVDVAILVVLLTPWGERTLEQVS
jgi:hypothetical protein